MIMTKMTTTTTKMMMMMVMMMMMIVIIVSRSLPGWIQYSPILFDFLFFVCFLHLANVYMIMRNFNSHRWLTISTYQQQKPLQAPEDRLQIGET